MVRLKPDHFFPKNQLPWKVLTISQMQDSLKLEDHDKVISLHIALLKSKVELDQLSEGMCVQVVPNIV